MLLNLRLGLLTKNQSVDLMLNGLNSDSSKPYCDMQSQLLFQLLQWNNKYLPKGRELKVKEIGLQLLKTYMNK